MSKQQRLNSGAAAPAPVDDIEDFSSDDEGALHEALRDGDTKARAARPAASSAAPVFGAAASSAGTPEFGAAASSAGAPGFGAAASSAGAPGFGAAASSAPAPAAFAASRSLSSGLDLFAIASPRGGRRVAVASSLTGAGVEKQSSEKNVNVLAAGGGGASASAGVPPSNKSASVGGSSVVNPELFSDMDRGGEKGGQFSAHGPLRLAPFVENAAAPAPDHANQPDQSHSNLQSVVVVNKNQPLNKSSVVVARNQPVLNPSLNQSVISISSTSSHSILGAQPPAKPLSGKETRRLVEFANVEEGLQNPKSFTSDIFKSRGGYMDVKTRRMQEQFAAQVVDAPPRLHPAPSEMRVGGSVPPLPPPTSTADHSDKRFLNPATTGENFVPAPVGAPKLFSGLSFWLTGRTRGLTDRDIRKMVLENGGIWEPYGMTRVSHIIAENLAMGNQVWRDFKQSGGERKRYCVVTPKWLVDSIAKGEKVWERDYLPEVLKSKQVHWGEGFFSADAHKPQAGGRLTGLAGLGGNKAPGVAREGKKNKPPEPSKIPPPTSGVVVPTTSSAGMTALVDDEFLLLASRGALSLDLVVTPGDAEKTRKDTETVVGEMVVLGKWRLVSVLLTTEHGMVQATDVKTCFDRVKGQKKGAVLRGRLLFAEVGPFPPLGGGRTGGAGVGRGGVAGVPTGGVAAGPSTSTKINGFGSELRGDVLADVSVISIPSTGGPDGPVGPDLHGRIRRPRGRGPPGGPVLGLAGDEEDDLLADDLPPERESEKRPAKAAPAVAASSWTGPAAHAANFSLGVPSSRAKRIAALLRTDPRRACEQLLLEKSIDLVNAVEKSIDLVNANEEVSARGRFWKQTLGRVRLCLPGEREQDKDLGGCGSPRRLEECSEGACASVCRFVEGSK